MTSLQSFLDGLLRRKYHPNLHPNDQLEGQGEKQNWKAIGDQPYFILEGQMPSGWVKVTVVASAEKRCRMGLCLDHGKGFTPSNYHLIGMTAQQPSIYQVYIHLDETVKVVRFDPVDEPCSFQVQDIIMARVFRVEIILRAIIIWFKRIGYRPREIFYAVKRLLAAVHKGGVSGGWRMMVNRFAPISDSYDEWVNRHQITAENIQEMKAIIAGFASKPVLSILMPVYNPREIDLRAAIESVLDQVYPYWELCLVDDASPSPLVIPVLQEYQARDPRIKLKEISTNGGIVAASNQALEMASGDFFATVDHDDIISIDALFEIAKQLNQHPEADMIYSDEDKVTADGIRYMPYFKPDWSPDLIFSHMYTAHLAVYRRTTVVDLGGFRPGFNGAQDWDLVLRLSEKSDKIFHIPKILYHWRSTAGSTAQTASNKRYAYDSAQHALQEAVDRRGWPATVNQVAGYSGFFQLKWRLVGTPKISIIICTRDKPDYLERCLVSIFEKTVYSKFEVIVIDNQSRQKATLELFEYWKKKEPDRFSVLPMDIPFNFSILNNAGARIANGEMLLFLNNDIEVIEGHWLETMAAQGQRHEIGVVGPLLLYPNGTIQHAGIVVGINDWAGHSFRGFPAESTGYCGRLLGASNVSAVTGACMLIRREVFFGLGCLDENLPVAGGDVELCLRGLAAGYRNIFLPDVRLLHHESITRGYEDNPDKRERFLVETEYVRERWPERMAIDPYYNPNLTKEKEDYSLSLE
jgi:O-antigen biosynthesis protein